MFAQPWSPVIEDPLPLPTLHRCRGACQSCLLEEESCNFGVFASFELKFWRFSVCVFWLQWPLDIWNLPKSKIFSVLPTWKKYIWVTNSRRLLWVSANTQTTKVQYRLHRKIQTNVSFYDLKLQYTDNLMHQMFCVGYLTRSRYKLGMRFQEILGRGLEKTLSIIAYHAQTSPNLIDSRKAVLSNQTLLCRNGVC